MVDTSQGLPSEWIARLFARFQAIYGNRVGTMWGDAPVADVQDAWQTHLAGSAAEDLRAALDACTRFYADYPPTLPQFYALVRDARLRRTQGVVKIEHKRGREPIPPEVLGKIKALTDKWRVKA